jgi:hypothetical protein
MIQSTSSSSAAKAHNMTQIGNYVLECQHIRWWNAGPAYRPMSALNKRKLQLLYSYGNTKLSSSLEVSLHKKNSENALYLSKMSVHWIGIEKIRLKCNVMSVQVCANYRTFSVTAKFLVLSYADVPLNPTGPKIKETVYFISIFWIQLSRMEGNYSINL